MKYYSLYNLLMFFKHQQSTNFKVIKNIVHLIETDEYSDEESRVMILTQLRECWMKEEHFQKVPEEKPMLLKTEEHQLKIPTEEFKVRVEDRTYRILFYKN